MLRNRFPHGGGVWHKNGVDAYPGRRRAPRPLDEQQLQELALRYVGRFATTRAKLASYLTRKVRERGWSGDRDADVQALAERLSGLGYIDDAAYALSKARSLTGRGYGVRRVDDSLRRAGVQEEQGREARRLASDDALASALRLAERRRIGPFAIEPLADPRAREKAIGALARAGHSYSLARAIVELPPGADLDLSELAERARLTDL